MPEADLPLIATADEQLLDDALRWCAAVGATPEVAADVTAARRSWRQAPVVIVGDDLAERLVAADLPRRDHVLLVARDPARWWPGAVALGALGVFGSHDEDGILEALSSALDGRGEACLVSVVGGSGGVGASTLAAALALSAGRRGLRSMLLDADPLGGGIELVLGAEHAEGLRWRDVDATRGRLSAGSLADVLPTHRHVATLSWDRSERPELPESVPSVLAAAVRGFDVVVADVPRHLDAVGADIVGRSVLTVLVVAEEVRAVGAARHVLARVQECAPAVAVVSVSRSGGIGPDAVAEALGLPVLARHRHDRRIRSSVDRGHGPGRSRAARRTSAILLDALGLEAA
jgi:secretion/DNA translocation related CpaE-like protein